MEGMGGPGLLLGEKIWTRDLGCGNPATRVADFFASDWSGGENDLTCLEEPLVVAWIWGWGGVLRARWRSLGAENTSPPAWQQPSVAACGLALERGQTSPRAGTRTAASSRERRGADVGADLTPGSPSSSASLGGSLLLGSRTSRGSWGEGR